MKSYSVRCEEAITTTVVIYCHELRFQAWTLQSSLFPVVRSSASSPCCNGLKLDERSWTMWIAFWGLILFVGSWPNCHEELCSGFFGSLLQAYALETDTHHTLSTQNLASSLGSPFSSSSSTSSSPGRVFRGASYRVPGITSEPEKGRSSLEDEIKHVHWIQYMMHWVDDQRTKWELGENSLTLFLETPMKLITSLKACCSSRVLTNAL
jgi:hypothetical protein